MDVIPSLIYRPNFIIYLSGGHARAYHPRQSVLIVFQLWAPAHAERIYCAAWWHVIEFKPNVYICKVLRTSNSSFITENSSYRARNARIHVENIAIVKRSLWWGHWLNEYVRGRFFITRNWGKLDYLQGKCIWVKIVQENVMVGCKMSYINMIYDLERCTWRDSKKSQVISQFEMETRGPNQNPNQTWPLYETMAEEFLQWENF